MPITALLKKIGKQVVDYFGNVRAVGAAGQKDSVLRRQRGAALQKHVFLCGKLGQLSRMGGRVRHLGIVGTAAQRVDLRVQRFQLLQNFLDHLRFLPRVWSCKIRVKTSFNSVRGTTWSTKPCSSWNSLR